MVLPGVTCIKRCMKILAPSYSTFCTGNNTSTFFFFFFFSAPLRRHAPYFCSLHSPQNFRSLIQIQSSLYLLASQAWHIWMGISGCIHTVALSCYIAVEKVSWASTQAGIRVWLENETKGKLFISYISWSEDRALCQSTWYRYGGFSILQNNIIVF